MNVLSVNVKKATTSSVKITAGIGLLIGALVGALVGSGGIQVAAFDWSDWALQLFPMLLAPLTLVVVYYTRVLIDQFIPAWALQLLPPLLGAIGTWLTNQATTLGLHPVLGALIGLAAALVYAAQEESLKP